MVRKEQVKDMRYQIRLINTETGKSMKTTWMFSNRKVADEFVANWKALGNPHDAEVIDTKKQGAK